MKVHLRCDQFNIKHATVTLFLNGANCGQLKVTVAESIWLCHILHKGCESLSPEGKIPFEFVSSGDFPHPIPEDIDESANWKGYP